MTDTDAVADADLRDRWTAMEKRYGESGVQRTFGLSMSVVGRGEVLVHFDGRPEGANRSGNTAGGVLTQMIDSAVVQAAATCISDGDGLTTLELKVNFVRAAPPGGPLTARATIKHEGRTTAVGAGEIVDAEGRTVALGLVTVALRRR
ncbi:MAG: thioesterase [Marmoricola sp.]|jgi:uncharacterized protein (TIGR00369 family)|nr:thioesterase [Marmoricola sp.]